MELLDKIAKSHPKIVTASTGEHIQTWGIPLRFYPSFTLVGVITQSSQQTVEARYVYNEVEMIFLDGAVSTIMQINAKEKLNLAPHQVSSYLCYFFDYTDGGKLHIVEPADQVTWEKSVSTNAEVAERARKACELIEPVQVIAPAGGGYQATAIGIYSSILVHITLHVESCGDIKPLTQRLLMADVPFARQYPRPRTIYSK